MTLAQILAQLKTGLSQQSVSIPSNWMQGRTSYGGLSTAIAYTAAKHAGGDDLPPLKSAQIAFAGPLAGRVDVECHMLRRGRNTAFMRADIISDGSVGLSCSFIFMAPRESQLDHCDLQEPEFPTLPAQTDMRSGPPEFFTSNVQYEGRRMELGQETPIISGWQRIIARDGLDPVAELLCIADGLPPSAMGLMTQKAMVSSMNWQVNLLTDRPHTQDGWWFLNSHTHHARNGASSQFMSVWNSQRRPVIAGMQSVAIFS